LTVEFVFPNDKEDLKGQATKIPDIILSALYSLPLLNVFVCVTYYTVCEKPHKTLIIYQLIFSTQLIC